jgi:hypothetical protein
LTVFFTRISDEDSMDSETRRLRWIRLDYRLRAIIVKMARMFDPENMPEHLLDQILHWIDGGGIFLRDFILPFEARMMSMSAVEGSATEMTLDEVSDREIWVLNTCFFVMKCLVGKTLFKPYKLRQMLNITKKTTDIGIFD